MSARYSPHWIRPWEFLRGINNKHCFVPTGDLFGSWKRLHGAKTTTQNEAPQTWTSAQTTALLAGGASLQLCCRASLGGNDSRLNLKLASGLLRIGVARFDG